jgi:hypothetical protein
MRLKKLPNDRMLIEELREIPSEDVEFEKDGKRAAKKQSEVLALGSVVITVLLFTLCPDDATYQICILIIILAGIGSFMISKRTEDRELQKLTEQFAFGCGATSMVAVIALWLSYAF